MLTMLAAIVVSCTPVIFNSELPDTIENRLLMYRAYPDPCPANGPYNWKNDRMKVYPTKKRTKRYPVPPDNVSATEKA